MTVGSFMFDTGAASDTGRVRSHNEDSFLVRAESGVWLVADGMGGHEAGDFASQTIAESAGSVGMPTSAPDLQARFMDRILRAHMAIKDKSARMNGATIGATLVALLTYDRHFACIWSGDSRIYLLRGGQFTQVTVDHTEVQELLRNGAITAAQAETWPRKNVITRAIGVHDRPMTDERSGELAHGDTFLLCSDGLTEHVDDAEMVQAMQQFAPQQACDQLVALTLSRGARDNVTVIVVRCLDRASAQPGPGTAAGAGVAADGYRPAAGPDDWNLER